MSIDTSDIDLDQLSQTAREIIEVIGLDAAFRLFEGYSGLHVYIPAKLDYENPIAKLIGYESWSKLWAVYQSCGIEVPKLDCALRQVRHRQIKEMADAGRTHAYIARRMNYSVRHVKRVLQRERQGSPARREQPNKRYYPTLPGFD